MPDRPGLPPGAPASRAPIPALLLALLPAMILLLALSGCCARTAYHPAPGETVPDALDFFDSSAFDHQLNHALSVGHPKVTVTFPAAVTLNNIPPRLDKWLSAVQETGGRVQAAPEPEGRGILEEIFSFFVRVYERLASACVYAPAEAYDALILYAKDTGMVTRVLFLERAPATAAANPKPATP